MSVQPDEILISKPVRPLPAAQLSFYTGLNSIHAESAGVFDAQASLEKLRIQTGSKVVAFECGGGSVRGGLYAINESGKFIPDKSFRVKAQNDNGAGFLEQMEALAEFARKHNLPVGMAYGGPLEGSKPLYHPKIAELMDGLRDKYDGDFAKIFYGLRFNVLNDGVAGLAGSVVEVASRHAGDPAIIYLINGGGLGLGVYRNKELIMTEAGHVESAPEMNPNGVTRPCGIYGDFVCMENIISNKQGLERQWHSLTGQKLNGRQIEDQLRAGSETAADLYDLAAMGQAVTIFGASEVFDIDIHEELFQVVVHGSTQRTPGLKERTAQFLWQEEAPKQEILFAEEFSDNACIDGAATFVMTRN